MSHNIWRRWVSRLFKQNVRTRPRRHRRLGLEALEDRLVPATDTWTGLGTGTTSADWTNVKNWSLNRAPITGDTVVFDNTGLITNRTLIDNLATNPIFSSVNISGTGYTLGLPGSSPLIVSGGINIASSVNTVTISQSVEFLPPPTTPQEAITVNNGSVLDLTGQIIAGNTVTVTKVGTGTLELASASSNWLGAFTLANSGGIVQIGNAQALGSTTVTINTNAQLQLAAPMTGLQMGSLSIANSLLTNGSGLVGDGALLNVSGNNTWSGSVQMDSDTTFGTAGGTQLTIGGTLSDNSSGHNLTKEGAGTLVFPNANTYRGTTTVNNGILEIENPLSLGAGANALDSQSGSPQSETIVNYNPTANEIGTLELNFTTLSSSDPNALTSGPKVVGFQVFNDILILNGPGFNNGFNNLGALYNAKGNNEWDGSVILGSAPPAKAFPVVDTAANTQLIVSGVVSDPNQVSMVYKTGAGELIFNDANTYRGGTDIEAGILDIDDSQALGTGTAYVVSGAALQLDVDQGFDGTAQRTHNRNLGFDSVTGSGPGQELDVPGTSGSFTLSLGGQTTAPLNVASLTLATDIQNALNGPSGLLALAGLTGETVSSVTQDGSIYRILFAGPFTDIPLITVSQSSIVVNPNGPISGKEQLGITGTSGSFTLSFTQAGTTYTSSPVSIGSPTIIADLTTAVTNLLNSAGFAATGDVSVTETTSGSTNLYTINFLNTLGNVTIPLMNPTLSPISVNPIYGLSVANSLVIDGPGVGTGPDTGALDSHSGINTYTGSIFNGFDAFTPPSPPVLLVLAAAAIGVEADSRPGHPLADNDYLQWDYSLTVTGQISGGDLIKTGLGNLILPNVNTYGDTTGIANPTTDIQLGWITIKNDQSLGTNQPPSQANLPQTKEPYVEIDSGGALHLDPQPGTSLTLYDNFFVTGVGLTSPTYGLIHQAGAIENLNGDNTLAGIIQLNGTVGIGVEQIPSTSPNPPNTGFPPLLPTSPPLTASQLTLTGYLWNYVNPTTGVVATGGLTKLGSRRLIIQGSGTYTGNVDVEAGVLLVQNNTALGAGNSTSPTPPTVTVENGAALEFGNTINGENVGNGFTSENGGVQDGIEVWGEDLVLNGSGDPTFDDSALTVLASNAPTTGPTVQTVTVTGSTAGTFTLSFDGEATTPLSATATAAQVQAAIDAALGFITGPLAGGSVTVVQSGNVYTITFGGSLINTSLQLLPVTTPFTGTFPVVNSTEIGTTSTVLAPVNDPIVATDSIWRGPVTLGNDTTITTDTNSTLPSSESDSRLILTGTVSDLYNPSNPLSPPPSDLTILGGGEVDLDGANTYTGTTYIQQGVVTIDNSQAFGSTGLSEIQTLTLTNPVANSTKFLLTFSGYAGINSPLTAGEMSPVITYTGNVVTDEAAITSALNGLTTVGGGTDTGGSVSVVETIVSGKVTITVTFGGTLTGFPQDLLTATLMSGAGSITPVATRVQAGAGGTVVENGASLQVAGSFTVAGEPLILEGNGTTQDIQTVTIPGGSTGTFVLGFTGPDSTGTTVTDFTTPLSVTSATLASDIQNALEALSNIGGVGGNVTVTETTPTSGLYEFAFGGTLSGDDVQTLAPNSGGVTGGTVTAQTTQVGVQTIAGVPTQWFQVGPAPTNNGQTNGNQPVSGTVTTEAVDPRDPTVLYVGTAGGGVWKSIDNGNSWQPIFDAVPEIQTITVPEIQTITVSTGTTGTFRLSFTGSGVTDTTTALNAASPTLANDIMTALDSLGNIGGVGGSVTVTKSGNTYTIIFNGTLAGANQNLLSVVNVSLTGGTVTSTQTVQNGTFSLSFTGPNSNGIVITRTTTALNAASPTLASDIQSALDALSNIGGVGGQVTVSQSGNTYMITFNGTLAGAALNPQSVPLVVNNITLVGTVASQEMEAGLDPTFSMYVGAIAIDPKNSNIIYVGTGEADTAGDTQQNEVANDAFYGTGVYESTDGGLTWSLLVDNSSGQGVTNPATGTTLVNPLYGMGVTGIAVDPATGNSANPTIYVSDGTVGGTGVGDGVPNGNNGEADVLQGAVQPGGTGQLAGVWRFTSVNGITTWFDLTNVVSSPRGTLDGKQSTPPGTPGPDDDFRVQFPQVNNVVWTDVQVIDTGIAEDGGEDGSPGTPVPVLYAALGSPGQWGGENVSPLTPLIGGSPARLGDNAVYRAYNPESDSPTWYIGDPGTPVDQVETITFTDPSGFNLEFNLGFNGVFSPNTTYNPNINMSGILTSILNGLPTIGGLTPPGSVTVSQTSQTATVSVYTVTFGGALSDTPLPLIQSKSVNGLTIQVSITTPGGGVDTETNGEFPTYFVNGSLNGDIRLSVVAPPPGPDDSIEFTTVYAAVPNSTTGNLLNIYESSTGGLSWGTVSTLPPEYMNGQGNYANDILAVNASTVYVGGDSANLEDPASMIFMTNNGGATWTDVTKATTGNSPHNAVHTLVADGNDVIVGTDGGIWQLNVTTTTVAPIITTITWNDLNSNLATAEVNGVDASQSNPNDMVVGTEGNGLAYFSNLLAWTESDENGAAGAGPSGGTVYIDPDNTNIVYAVLNNPPPGSLSSNFLESTDGGKTWKPVAGLGQYFFTQDYPYFTFLIDSLNSNRLLVGGPAGLQESLDGGNSWLTLLNDDITSMSVAGYQGVFVSDPSFPDVTDIGANVDDSNTIYASDGNNLFVTKDLALRWVDRTPTGIVGTIESITVNPANRDNVFVVTQGTPGEGLNQIWESTDAGQSWNLIGGGGSSITGLSDIPLWQLVIDPRTGNLYVGTDNGVYELTDAAPLTAAGPAAVPTAGTVAWERFGTGMPNVSVRVLKLDQSTNTLLAGTYGRGVYQLFLDASESTTNPAIAGAIGLSGASFWTGPVILVGDAATNNVTVGADGTQGIPDGITAASINFVGPISDLTAGSNPTLNKNGDGDVIFSGTNTYGGSTTIGQGNLIAENLDALGGNTNGTTVIAGASLGLLANLDAEPVTLNGNGISFDDHNLGSLRNISGDNTFTGNVTVNLPPAEAVQSVTIEADSGSEMIMEGAISGGGVGFTLVKEGTGTVAFDNTSPNTYTGTTAIYQGALQAETSTAFSSGTVEVLDGAQVQLQTPAGGSSVNVANPLLLSGTGINNTGALLDTGGSNTWSGPITFEILPGFAPLTLTQGTVAIGADAGTTLTLSGEIDEETSPAMGIPNGLLPMGLLKVGAGTVALSNSNHYSGSTEVAQGILDVQNSAALGDRITAGGLETIEQIVTLSNAGANGLGTGEFTLSFDGKTATASKLNFGASSSAVQNVLEGVGGGGGLFASAGLVGATVHVYRTAIQTTTENGPSAISPASDVTGWVYTLIFGGSLAQTPLQVEAIGTQGTLASTNVVAAGGVDVLVDSTVKGTGELELDNSALLPAGTGLVVSNYTLTLNGSGPNGQGALYNLVGDNTWSGPVILAANDSLPSTKHTLDAVGVAAPTATNPDISLSLTNVQSVSTQVGSLVPLVPELDKVGPGTLIFPFGATYTAETTFSTGDSTTALGTTLISAGNVQVDAGTEAASFGAILLGGGTLDGNGTGTLGGNNIVGGVVSSINNATSAAGGGTIDPGDNYPNEASGLITSSGNVNLNSNDTVYVNLGLPTNTNLPPSTSNNNDIFDVVGTINLDGATLTGLVNVNVAIGDSYTIINAGSVEGEFNGSSVTPTESGATAATIAYIGGVKFEVDYFSNRVDVIRELVHETMTLAPSLSSPVYGQDEQFIATLTSTDPSTPTSQPPAATGTVVFTVTDPTGAVFTYDVVLPTSPATGVAILDLPSILDAPLMEGGLGYTVTATYNGIDANGNATFTPIPIPPAPPPSTSVTVSPENTTTTLSLTYPLPEVYGETFTIVASVATTLTSPVANTLAPAGSVSFYDGAEIPANLLATVPLTSPLPGATTATATLVSTALSNLVAAGNHTIFAVYNENLTPENYLTSSGAVGLSIHQAASTVTVTTPPLSPAPVYGQSGVTFTAVVAPVSPGSGNPTGAVTFEDGSLILGSGTLSTTGGVTTATYTTTAGQLLVGNPTQISAIYPGDNNFTGNTGTLAEVVKQANTAMTLSSSAPSPPGAPDGQTVTFTATVAAVSPGGGNPTGLVTFKNGSTILGLGALSTAGGVTTATFTISAYQLPVGIATITASYPGDSNFIGSSSTLSQTITQSLSTTTVNTSGASVYGQPVTFTATVKPTVVGGPIPTGTVTFYVTVNSSLVQLGSGTLGTTGGATTASYTTTVGQLPVATNETITAVYSGNSQYTTSTGTTSQTVSQDSTSTILTSSGSITPSESVTFTAQVVANSPGGGNPTGSVSFMAGSTLLGTANLTTVNGVTTAQITVPGSELMVGANAITSTYGGDGNFLGSNGSMSEIVEEGTTTTVTSSPSPSVYGQAVTLTATITPSVPLSTSPTGTVTFSIGSTTLGSATVGTAGGLSTAILIISNLPAGSNQTIVASYSGDGTFIGSSGSVSQTVNKTPTKTTLSSTATSIELGQPVIFTVQVSPVAPGGGTPTGTVTFKNGAVTITTVPLVGGVVTFQRTLGIVGKNSITAVYNGDTNDLPSTSAPVVETVAAAGTRHSAVTVTSSVNPSAFGQSVTFTATVKDTGLGAAHIPTGTADFFDGTTLLGYGTLSTTAGVTTATFTTSTLPLGSNSISAAYNGNAIFAHSVSVAITQTVNAAPVRPSVITLSASSATSSYGVPVTFSATVTDEGSGAAQTPTGTVTFTATNTTTNAVFNMGSGTLSGANGIATTSISYATLPVGIYKITATYSGDGSFIPESTLTALPHTVTESNTAIVTLSSSLPSGSVHGQAVTFTATVSILGSTVIPPGAVEFILNPGASQVVLGTFSTNSNGVATFKTSALPTGDDIIGASYTGDLPNVGPTDPNDPTTLDQTVNQAATKMTLTSTSVSNAPVTMTATVTAVAPGAGIPTGTASFYIDSLFVGIATVNSNGVVTLTYSAGVSPGNHTIEVVYSGDNNFLGSDITKVVKFVVGRGT